MGFTTRLAGLLWFALVAPTPSHATDPEPAHVSGPTPQWRARCGTGRAVTLDTLVTPVAEELAATQIRYVSSRERTLELADCSGNFLRVSSKIAALCPARANDLAILEGVPDWNGTLVDGSMLRTAEWISDFDLVRTTQTTAEWYARRGLFVPIFADRRRPATQGSRDLERVRDWFRPGTVVWFGARALSRRDCKLGRCKKDLISNIQHMGVVVSVDYDAAGSPIGYAMYHGRNERDHNGITDYHRWRPGSRPPFGNGDQAVLGIAPLVRARRKQ